MQTSKYMIRYLILSVLLFAMALPATAQKNYKELKYPKLHEIKIPKVQEIRLKNGMRLFLLEDHELPLIHVSARIRVGSIYDPEDKIGLAEITGQVMRTGGTDKMTGDEIDDILEKIAASVETNIGQSAGYASMSVLKEDFDTGLDILADVLMHPAFREDKLELAKIQQRSAIARRNDNVSQIAFREFTKLIYGPNSVYARHPEYATIDNITRDDLVAFHKKYFHPNNILLGVWGDFDRKELIGKIEKAFAEWEPVKIDFPPIPEVKYEFKPTVNLIRKTDVNQTNILMGHIGGYLSDPDYYALVIMNRILGSGFTSRLFRNVRSRQGLAYSVFGNYSADFDHPGIFYVGCQTKSQTTVKAIRAMLKEVKKITESEVTDEELELAKSSYLNSFVFKFDSKGKIINRILTYAYYDYPLDFLQKTKENIEKVTKADILRAARSHLHPDAMQILAVGNPDEFDEPLSVLGEVNEIDITIPVPKEEKPEATEATVKKGQALLQKAIEACGGKEAFAGIDNMYQESSVTVVSPQGEMELSAWTTMVFPDRLIQILKTPMGEMRQVLNGDQAWMVSPQGTMDLPESQREEMKKSLFRELVALLRLGARGEVEVQYLGSEEKDGKRYEIIMLSDKDAGSVKLYLDAESFLPLRELYQGKSMQGPTEIETVYTDFREIGGIKVPVSIVAYAGGKKIFAGKIKELKLNVPVDESAFKKK